MLAPTPFLGPLLLFVDTLQTGGPGRLVVTLAGGLRRRGVDVCVAHLGVGDWRQEAAALEAAGVPTIDLALRRLADPRPVLRLAGYLRRERVRVMHTHNRYAHLVGRPAAALASCAVASTDHWIVETDDVGVRGAIRCLLDDATARAFGGELVLVSRTQRAVHERARRLGGVTMHTIHNGVDTDVFRPDADARRRMRRQLGVADDVPLVAAVAVLRAGKGHDHLLDAMARLRARVPTAELLVVGDGDERAHLERQAAALGIEAAVHFLGGRRDVAEVLTAADAFAHPSLFETLPTSILEAMAVGLAVVATNVGGVPELVTDGETGLLVPAADAAALADALVRALDPSRGARLGRAARAWVEANASLDAWLDRHLALYARLAAR